MGKKFGIFMVLALLGAAFIYGFIKRDAFVTNKGVFYFKKGEYARAADKLEEAAGRRPEHYPTAWHLSRSYWKLRRRARAAEVLRRFIRDNEDDAEARKDLAFLEFLAGNAEKADSIFSGLLSEDPDELFSPEEKALAGGLGSYLEQKPYAALRRLPEGPLSAPEYNSILMALRGMCYSDVGLTEKAEVLFEASREAFPGNPLVLYHLALLKLQKGETGQARYAYHRRLALLDEQGASSRRNFPPDALERLRDAEESMKPYQLDRERVVGENEPIREERLNELPGVKIIPDKKGVQYAVFRDAGLEFDLTAPESGSYTIFIEARGTPSRFIYPMTRISVNGIEIDGLYVSAELWRLFPVKARLAQGKNVVTVKYVNDGELLAEGEDRNLFIRGLYIFKEE